MACHMLKRQGLSRPMTRSAGGYLHIKMNIFSQMITCNVTMTRSVYVLVTLTTVVTDWPDSKRVDESYLNLILRLRVENSGSITFSCVAHVAGLAFTPAAFGLRPVRLVVPRSARGLGVRAQASSSDVGAAGVAAIALGLPANAIMLW